VACGRRKGALLFRRRLFNTQELSCQSSCVHLLLP
jgi:hypothetical protein